MSPTTSRAVRWRRRTHFAELPGLIRPWLWSEDGCVIAAEEFDLVVREATVGDAGSDPVHQPHHEPLVVDGGQRRGQHFLCPEQVVHIGPGVVRAGVAVAIA